MKIIDAHLHLFPSEPKTDAMAQEWATKNSVAHPPAGIWGVGYRPRCGDGQTRSLESGVPQLSRRPVPLLRGAGQRFDDQGIG